MATPKENKDVPSYIFLADGDVTIGTPSAIEASDRTSDIPFADLAANYDLQTRLKLLSAVLIKPDWNPPIAYPMEGKELVKHAAFYLASFCDNPKERKLRQKYLEENRIVRIIAPQIIKPEATRR